MRKIIVFILTLLLIPSLIACDDRPVLRILAPGEYMSKEVRDSFTQEYGIRVRIDEFDSNEAALTFIKSNRVYDLILPSDYALEQLITEDQGYIKEIDWQKITTFDKESDLADGLDDILNKLKEDSDLDLLKYGVPYFWGSIGILYNADVVSEADLTGWDLLQKGDDYKVAFYDSSRDALMTGLVSLGYSMNSNVESEIREAEAWIRVATDKNVGYLTDDIFDYMPDGTYDLAMAYTGDAAEIINRTVVEKEDINLDFFIPEQGSNIWADFLVIHSKGNEEYAYQFLNHILSFEGATQNTSDVFYISPREDVRLLQIENALTDNIKELYQVVFRENDEIFRFDPKSKQLIDDAWNRIGTAR